MAAAKLTAASLQKARNEVSGETLKKICGKASALQKERLRRATQCGAWLITLPKIQNGTELDQEEVQ